MRAAGGLLGLIPARCGSKGIPGKNIKLLGGKPLIAHTIEAARASGVLQCLLVSTDDEAIASAAREYGAQVPWLRPAELATDSASVIDSVLHVLDRLAGEAYEPMGVVLLQPTSPFRTPETIRAACERFCEGGESVVSVSEVRQHPYWCKRLAPSGELMPFLEGVEAPVTRQELPQAFAPNGVVYVSSVANLRKRRSFYSEHTLGLVIRAPEALDLDTPWDWHVTECLWARRQR